MGDFDINYKIPYSKKGFESITEMHGFKQLTNKPSVSSSATIIDSFFANSSENIINSDVFTTSLSDHHMSVAVRKINNGKFRTRALYCHNYSNYDKKLVNYGILIGCLCTKLLP